MNERGIEYKLVRATSDEELEQKVNRLIEKGWRPLGGACISAEGNNAFRFFQTMIRTNDD